MKRKDFNFQFNKQSTHKVPSRKTLVILGSVIGGLLLIAAIVTFIVLSVLSGPSGNININGTYRAETEQNYVYREYEEYFSQETLKSLAMEDNLSAHGYYEFYNAFGRMIPEFCGVYDGEKEPDVLKAEILESFSKTVTYTEEALAKCTLKLYQPVSEIVFRIDTVTIAQENVIVNGTLVQEEATPFTLTGTYTQAENGDLSPVFTSENETLIVLINGVFQSMRYEYSVDGNNTYVNSIIFADQIQVKQ